MIRGEARRESSQMLKSLDIVSRRMLYMVLSPQGNW
jgi:hypothetical protein